MNRSFIIMGVPAFIISFCWIYYDWGLLVASIVIALELTAAIGGILYLRKRSPQTSRR